jgi:hypothetical protein
VGRRTNIASGTGSGGRSQPPEWVNDFVRVVAAEQQNLQPQEGTLTSDIALSVLRTGLSELGYQVESKETGKIKRPVLFGDEGAPRVTYEVDAYHPEHKVLVEIEAGRGWQGNAVFRDIVRTSLIADADFLVIGMLQEYKFGKNKTPNRSYDRGRSTFDAIYASGRLGLPFKGILLFGY